MPLPIQQKPKGPKNWGKFSKTLSFWVLITLLAGTLFTYTSGSRDSATKMEYWQFNEQLEANNVRTATVVSGRTVTGEFRNKVDVNRRPVTRYTVHLPVANSEDLVTRLETKGVQVSGEEQSASFGNILLMFLPYIIIFG